MTKAATVEKEVQAQKKSADTETLWKVIDDVDESLTTLKEQLTGLDVLLETVCREYTYEMNWETMILRVKNDPERLHDLTRMMWDYLTSAKDEVMNALKKTSPILDEKNLGA